MRSLIKIPSPYNSLPMKTFTLPATKRTSLIFIGDSITWGHGLMQNQTWAYQLQHTINTNAGFSPIYWGNVAYSAPEICARYIHIDDTTPSPFNGGQPPSGGQLVTLTGGSGVAAGPFVDNLGNTGGNVHGDSGFTAPGIQISGSSQYITIPVQFPSSGLTNCYIFVGITTTGGTDEVNVYADWIGGGSTAINSLPVATPGSLIGPFTGPTFGGAPYSQTNYIYVKGYNAFPVVNCFHITPIFPANYTIVQICGRNSYSIGDFSSSTIAQDIMNSAIATTTNGNNQPIYVLSLGTVSMYDAGNSRQVTPSVYSSQLSTLASALLNSSYTNYAAAGNVILTVPLLPELPTSGSTWWGNLASFSQTQDAYRQAVITLGQSMSLPVVDLTQVSLGSNYQDGLHPTATGASSVAAYYEAFFNV